VITTTRETRRQRAARLAQGPIRVRWDRVAAMAMALVSMLGMGALVAYMFVLWADGLAL
jgi:hypothetical protein